MKPSGYHFISLGLLLFRGAVAKPPYHHNKPTPKGFVKTEGDKFTLDGEDFYFAGSNAYYFPFNNVPMDLPLIAVLGMSGTDIC